MIFYKQDVKDVQEEDELYNLLIATQKLGLPVETRSLCFNFYHRTSLVKMETSALTRLVTALNLSMKINENVKKFKEIFSVISLLLQEKDDLLKVKDEMMILELKLQENTEFLLEFDSPFRFLILLLKDLKLSRQVGRKSWKICQFCLFSPVILQIVPQAIAFSCIYISLVLSREKVHLSVKSLEKYFISQEQVVKGVKGVLKLLLNKKIKESLTIGEDQDQDLIFETLNFIETNGLVDYPGFLAQPCHQNIIPQAAQQNQGHGQNQSYGHAQNHYGRGGVQIHGRPIHAGFREGRGDQRVSMTMNYEKRSFKPAGGIPVPFSRSRPPAITHGVSYTGIPEKRRRSEELESSLRDYENRKRHSSTESYSESSTYDMGTDRDADYHRDRDNERNHTRDNNYVRDKDYERRSEHRDRHEYKTDDREYRRKSYDQGSSDHIGKGYDQGSSDHRRKSYDQGRKSFDQGSSEHMRVRYNHRSSDHRRINHTHEGSRFENGGHRNDSTYSSDRYSKNRRDGSSYQSQSSYYSKR